MKGKKNMKKSINDLMAQAQRVNEMISVAGGWKLHHLHFDPQTIWQMARRSASRRSLGIFEHNRDLKRELIY